VVAVDVEVVVDGGVDVVVACGTVVEVTKDDVVVSAADPVHPARITATSNALATVG
jgi:hypothetical protein